MKTLNVKRKNNVKRVTMTLLLAVLTTTAWALEQDPADGYYLIGSAQDWQDFATRISDGTIATNANARMTADIDLGDDQTMLGSFATPYAGIFDGQGHTLTINYNTSSMTIESGQSYLGAAPFRDIQNATIRNLHTAGTVTADKIGATGLVGWAYGTNTIERCWSSVDIVSSNNTADTFSGFVFRQDGSLLTMNDCFYSGKIQSVAKTSHAGFVGHHTAGTVVLNNCLVIFADGTDVPATSDRWTKCYTFVRNQDYSQYIITLNHCYYKTALGTVQGTQATTEQLADGTTATALQAGRTEEIWMQQGSQPMLKTFASLWQDSEGTYCIGTDAGWTAFANGINDGTIAAATNVKLMADITATTMIGSFSGNFNTSKLYSGIFDGNHHTITANINNSSTNYVALISGIRNATIMDLTVAGSISGGQHCSGLVSVADGTNTISNVSISATITGSNSHCAGVLGHSYSSVTTINDCIFTGTINGRSSGSTIGVFNGWSNSTGVSINNCVEAGTYTNNSNFNPIAFSGLISYSHNYFITPAKNSNYVYGTQMSASIPDGEVYGQLTIANNTYYIPTVVSGIGNIYELIDDPITPEPIVTYIGNFLTKGTDYTVSYSNNDAVGMATVTITGAGEFSGEKNINFIIYSSDYALIGTAEQLRNFATLVNSGVTNAKGKLIADIDLAGDDDNQWTPIGTDANKYNGTFDGQGFTIKNLYYKQQVEGVGLFGFANSGAYIKNVRVEGTVDNSTNGAGAGNGGTQTCAGGIIGKSYEATVLNCSFSGNVISYSNVGGLVGWGTATIVNCYNEGTVMFHSTVNQTGGGVHGYGGSPQLKNCYNVGSVINNGSASYAIGSLSVSGSVSNSYSRSGCVQNGNGASWINAGNTGTVMSFEDMKSEAFVTTLNTNVASLRTTYPDISEWTQDPITNQPVLKIFASLTQDENGYYLLGSVQDWKNFAELVNTTPTANAKMTADIDLGDDQTMVGTYAVKYQGTFDGQGHTLTINYNTSSMTIESGQSYLGAAPFRDIQNATIRNLHTAGTVTADKIGATGMVGWAYGACVIERCCVSVNITATAGDTFSGFVFRQDGTSLQINDCIFNGSIMPSEKHDHGGFVGHAYNGQTTVNNCLMLANCDFNGTRCYVFVRTVGNQNGTFTINNSYYQTFNGISQGTQVTATALAYGTVATALQAGRQEIVWVQDPVTNRPMLKIFANSLNINVTGYQNENNRWMFIASPIAGSIAPSDVDGLLGMQIQDNPVLYNYDLYRFNQSGTNGEWENYHQHNETGDPFLLVNGKGYLYAKQNDATLKFYGALYDGNSKDVDLDYDDEATFAGYNLVGNPFVEEATVNMPYYKMNAAGDDIEPETSSVAIPAFTGVIVQATTTEQHVTFTKSGGTKSGGKPEKQGSLQLTLTKGGPSTGSGTIHDKAIVSFNEGAQLGKYIFNENHAKLYIPQGSEDYAIVSVGRDGVHTVSTEVPINFKAAENGTYTLSANLEGVEMSYLHLIDNMTGADVDLLQTSAYTFTAKTTDYESRFKLVFVCGDANDDNGDNETFAFISNGNIIVNGTGTLQIIDVMGRIVYSGDTKHCVSTTGMAPGVYVLRLINGDNVKVQKMIVR